MRYWEGVASYESAPSVFRKSPTLIFGNACVSRISCYFAPKPPKATKLGSLNPVQFYLRKLCWGTHRQIRKHREKMSLKRDTDWKWDTTNYTYKCVSKTDIFRICYRYVFMNKVVLAVPEMGQVSWSRTFLECENGASYAFYCHSCVYVKSIPIIFKKKPRENTSKVGHGPKVEQNCACSLWFSHLFVMFYCT